MCTNMSCPPLVGGSDSRRQTSLSPPVLPSSSTTDRTCLGGELRSPHSPLLRTARQARLVRDSGGILGSCAPLPRPKGLPALVALRARPLRGCCSLCSCSLSCPTVPPHGLSLGLRPRLSAIRRSIGTRQATCGAKLRPRPSAWLRATPGMGGLRPGNARSLRESTF